MCCKINYLEGSKSTLLMYIKTVQHLWDTIFLYMSIGSVVFSSYVLRKRNEMPKIKGKKIYKPHGFYSIKNTVGKVLSLRRHLPPRRCPPCPPARGARRFLRSSRAVASGGPAAPGLLPAPGAVHTFRAASAQLGRCLLLLILFFFLLFCFVFVLF